MSAKVSYTAVSLRLGLMLVLVVLCTDFGAVSARTYPQGRLATLQGSVTIFDDFGELLPLTWVRMNAISPDLNMTVYTNGYGFYVMVLPLGSYSLTPYLRSYSSSTVNVTLAPSQVLTVNFHLLLLRSPQPHWHSSNCSNVTRLTP